MTFTELAPVASDPPEPFTDRLRLAVAAYLARFKGSSREHTESDLRCYLAWCTQRGLDPLAAQRPHLELYIRWMQEISGRSPRRGPGWRSSRSAPWSAARLSWPPSALSVPCTRTRRGG
jgi:hypothetical protein